MSGRFTDNPDYREYERLSIRLHELIAAGLGDSDEAERLRDQMDGPWKRMRAEEIARLDGLSADLYMLSGDEISGSMSTSDVVSRRVQLDAARDARDAERVLSLLRVGPPVLSAHDTAAMRAWAYDTLGHGEAARLFTEYATHSSYLSGRRTRPFHVSFGNVAA